MEGVGTVRLDASQISCQASVQRVRSGLFFFFSFFAAFLPLCDSAAVEDGFVLGFSV